MASFIPVVGEIDEVDPPTTVAELRGYLGEGRILTLTVGGLWLWIENLATNERVKQWIYHTVTGPCLYCSWKESQAVSPLVCAANPPPKVLSNAEWGEATALAYGQLKDLAAKYMDPARPFIPIPLIPIKSDVEIGYSWAQPNTLWDSIPIGYPLRADPPETREVVVNYLKSRDGTTKDYFDDTLLTALWANHLDKP